MMIMDIFLQGLTMLHAVQLVVRVEKANAIIQANGARLGQSYSVRPEDYQDKK